MSKHGWIYIIFFVGLVVSLVAAHQYDLHEYAARRAAARLHGSVSRAAPAGTNGGSSVGMTPAVSSGAVAAPGKLGAGIGTVASRDALENGTLSDRAPVNAKASADDRTTDSSMTRSAPTPPSAPMLSAAELNAAALKGSGDGSTLLVWSHPKPANVPAPELVERRTLTPEEWDRFGRAGQAFVARYRANPPLPRFFGYQITGSTVMVYDTLNLMPMHEAFTLRWVPATWSWMRLENKDVVMIRGSE